MVSRIEADTTAEGLYAYYANKSILGEIVRAKMLGNKEKVTGVKDQVAHWRF